MTGFLVFCRCSRSYAAPLMGLSACLPLLVQDMAYWHDFFGGAAWVFFCLLWSFLASGGKRSALDRCGRRVDLRHRTITAAQPLTLFAGRSEAQRAERLPPEFIKGIMPAGAPGRPDWAKLSPFNSLGSDDPRSDHDRSRRHDDDRDDRTGRRDCTAALRRPAPRRPCPRCPEHRRRA